MHISTNNLVNNAVLDNKIISFIWWSNKRNDFVYIIEFYRSKYILVHLNINNIWSFKAFWCNYQNHIIVYVMHQISAWIFLRAHTKSPTSEVKFYSKYTENMEIMHEQLLLGHDGKS